ncbi:MAG: hypothetical protein AAF417_22255, partial [Pseudomonadota bacterium]
AERYEIGREAYREVLTNFVDEFMESGIDLTSGRSRQSGGGPQPTRLLKDSTPRKIQASDLKRAKVIITTLRLRQQVERANPQLKSIKDSLSRDQKFALKNNYAAKFLEETQRFAAEKGREPHGDERDEIGRNAYLGALRELQSGNSNNQTTPSAPPPHNEDEGSEGQETILTPPPGQDPKVYGSPSAPPHDEDEGPEGNETIQVPQRGPMSSSVKSGDPEPLAEIKDRAFFFAASSIRRRIQEYNINKPQNQRIGDDERDSLLGSVAARINDFGQPDFPENDEDLADKFATFGTNFLQFHIQNRNRA